MSYATRKAPDRFHLLSIPQLLFSPRTVARSFLLQTKLRDRIHGRHLSIAKSAQALQILYIPIWEV